MFNCLDYDYDTRFPFSWFCCSISLVCCRFLQKKGSPFSPFTSYLKIFVTNCWKNLTAFFKNYVNASIPKEKTGALSFFESFILMQRLTVLSVLIHETTAHVMSSFDPLHALGLLVCITALSERSTLWTARYSEATAQWSAGCRLRAVEVSSSRIQGRSR